MIFCDTGGSPWIQQAPDIDFKTYITIALRAIKLYIKAGTGPYWRR